MSFSVPGDKPTYPVKTRRTRTKEEIEDPVTITLSHICSRHFFANMVIQTPTGNNEPLQPTRRPFQAPSAARATRESAAMCSNREANPCPSFAGTIRIFCTDSAQELWFRSQLEPQRRQQSRERCPKHTGASFSTKPIY